MLPTPNPHYEQVLSKETLDALYTTAHLCMSDSNLPAQQDFDAYLVEQLQTYAPWSRAAYALRGLLYILRESSTLRHLSIEDSDLPHQRTYLYHVVSSGVLSNWLHKWTNCPETFEIRNIKGAFTPELNTYSSNYYIDRIKDWFDRSVDTDLQSVDVYHLWMYLDPIPRRVRSYGALYDVVLGVCTIVNNPPPQVLESLQCDSRFYYACTQILPPILDKCPTPSERMRALNDIVYATHAKANCPSH